MDGMDGLVTGWMDKQKKMDGQMDEWMAVWMNE